MPTEKFSAITLVIADDHGIVREGIAALCRSRADITILGQCSDGEQALQVILALQPDFAVLDLQMPKLSGLEVTRRVKQTTCLTRLILLSVCREEKQVRELFRGGADGYVLKDGPGVHLFDAITTIAAGGRYLSPLLRQDLLEPLWDEAGGAAAAFDPLSQLSKREHEVFTLLVDGMRPRDIAGLLQISPKTVDTYRANIMRKLEIDGIAGLVRFAIQRNIATAPPPG